MKEVKASTTASDLRPETFRASLATILELPLDEIPQPAAGEDPASGWTLSRWLGGLALGLVPVADAASFAWPGPWLARVDPPDGRVRFVVMYGVPSGVVWDPGGDGVVDRSWIADGFVVAASDIALARPTQPPPAIGAGAVAEVWVAPAAGAPAQARERVRAFAGKGLEGDRHTSGAGTFPSSLPGSALTLIEAEVCESFAPALRADEHRRNVVTRGIDLNGLVGRVFAIGAVRCRGTRLCEPCAVIDGYADRPLLRPLVHRGGLRADILDDGEIAVGDPLEVR